MALSVRGLGPSFAAEVTGVDLARGLDEATRRALHRAYLDHKVLAIRGQSLDAAQFHAFGERFGPVEPHTIAMYRHAERPGITILSNRTELGRPVGIRDAGSHWHSDYSYKAVPANATILYALEIPEEGGDTIFADLAAAYAALPDELKRRLAGRVARHHYRWHRDRSHPEARWNLLRPEEQEQTPEVIHPVIRRHPETGERSIFVFPGITSGVKGIVGMEEDESDRLLGELFRAATEERFQFRYRWAVGDVLVWDNRATMHCATTNVLPPDRFRTLWRINTTGTMPLPG
jgi:taurine dioxygenase